MKQHHTTSNGRQAKEGQNRGLLLQGGRRPCTTHRRDQLHRAEGHVEKYRLKLVETECFDDQWSKR